MIEHLSARTGPSIGTEIFSVFLDAPCDGDRRIAMLGYFDTNERPAILQIDIIFGLVLLDQLILQKDSFFFGIIPLTFIATTFILGSYEIIRSLIDYEKRR